MHAGLDLTVDKDYILSLSEGGQLVDREFKGPSSPGTIGLIIGRSSNYKKKKIEVLHGVIDSNFQGEVKIMIRPLKNNTIM